MTRELLSALPRRATLLCFEVNPRFCEYIRENLSDPRLELIQGSAEQLPLELAARGLGPVEAAVSSLGLTLMAKQEREAVLGGLASSLAVDGVFTQFQYLHALLPQMRPDKGNLERFTAARFLRRYFKHVESEVVWRNLPPAFVLTCRR
jgi:phospholipid N-methyltransferase